MAAGAHVVYDWGTWSSGQAEVDLRERWGSGPSLIDLDDEDETDETAAPLSYRSAGAIYFGIQNALEVFQECPEVLIDRLPAIVAGYADEAWLNRFLGTIRNIGLSVAAGILSPPACTAEEMAMHIVLDSARSTADELCEADEDSPPAPWWFIQEDEHVELVAERTVLELERAAEIFEDDDVLMLFDRALDGIESSDIGTVLGVANLHPQDWFTPFCEDAPILEDC